MSTQAHWNHFHTGTMGSRHVHTGTLESRHFHTGTREHWNLQISSSAVPRHDAGSFKRALPTKPIFAHKADLCAGSHW